LCVNSDELSPSSRHFRLSHVVFLKKSKNHLATLKARQATYAIRTHFLGFSIHRLTARCCPPDDPSWLAQFSQIFGIPMMLGRSELVSMICVWLVCCYYLKLLNWWKISWTYEWIWDLGFMLGLDMYEHGWGL